MNVLRLRKTARMNGIKLNSEKLQLKSTKCEFYRRSLTMEDTKIDDRKVEAIQQMSAPKRQERSSAFPRHG